MSGWHPRSAMLQLRQARRVPQPRSQLHGLAVQATMALPKALRQRRPRRSNKRQLHPKLHSRRQRRRPPTTLRRRQVRASVMQAQDQSVHTCCIVKLLSPAPMPPHAVRNFAQSSAESWMRLHYVGASGASLAAMRAVFAGAASAALQSAASTAAAAATDHTPATAATTAPRQTAAESAAERAARERAAAERAQKRAAAISNHDRVGRWWPQALYQYDFEERKAEQPASSFLVEADLQQIVAAERRRLLAQCGFFCCICCCKVTCCLPTAHPVDRTRLQTHTSTPVP